MDARGKVPTSSFERRLVQASGMMRHGQLPGLSSSSAVAAAAAAASHRSLESLPQSHLLEDKVADQEEEIERLAGDNRRLAKTHVALRDDLVSAAQDVQKLKSHIRSIQTESDIQIRVLLDKIAKMEVDIRAGDSVRKDLQKALIEAQSLAASRQELSAEIQRAAQEVKKAISDVKSLPDLQAELDDLVQERQRLRSTFEYEKSKNIELVDQMKIKEKNLIAMAREVEVLQAEILNAEKRANAPNLFRATTPVDGSGSFSDPYGRAHGQMATAQVGETMAPVVDSNGVAAITSGSGGGGDGGGGDGGRWA